MSAETPSSNTEIAKELAAMVQRLDAISSEIGLRPDANAVVRSCRTSLQGALSVARTSLGALALPLEHLNAYERLHQQGCCGRIRALGRRERCSECPV